MRIARLIRKARSPLQQPIGQIFTKEGAFPRTWDDIDIGRLVLAKEDGPWRSWWEAIPTEKSENSFTLRWRDFPQVPNVVRPRFSLALLCPHVK